MIESIQIETWAPDTDENNPSLILDSQSLYPVVRGVRTMIPPGKTAAPLILYATDKYYYPTPVNCYTAYWASGSSNRYVLTNQINANAAEAAGVLVDGGGTIAAFNGTLFNGIVPIAHKKGDQRAQEAATTPTSWDNAFELDVDYYGSFAQYGDYCILATGQALIYIKSTDADAPKNDITGTDNPAQSDADFKPKFVTQAGDFVFAACINGGGTDEADVAMDEMYWVTSIAGVINSGNGKPSFNPSIVGTNSQSARADDTPGPIIGMRSLDRSVVIYKRKSIYLLQASGTEITQQVISREVGPTGDLSVVDLGGRHVFMGPSDFYIIEGQAVQTLPNGCREFLFGVDGDLDAKRMHGVRGQLDSRNSCVYWYYPSMGYSSSQLDVDDGKPICDSWVCWNFVKNSWTFGRFRYFNATASTLAKKHVGQGVAAVCNPDIDLTDAITYSNIPLKVYGAAAATWANTPSPATILWGDDIFVSQPSRTAAVFASVINGAAPDPGETSGSPEPPARPIRIDFSTNVYDTDLVKTSLCYDPYVSASNKSLDGRLRTGDFGDGVNYKFVRGVRPRFVGNKTPGSVTCTVYVRQHLYDQWEISSTTSSGQVIGTATTGGAPFWFHIRSNSRYHQFEFTYDGNNESGTAVEFSGYDIDYDDAGTR